MMRKLSFLGMSQYVGAATCVCLAVVLLPRSIQRGAPFANPTLVGAMALAGAAVLALVVAATIAASRVLPGKAAHQVVSRYISPAFGTVAAAARFAAFALLLVLAAGLVGMAVNALTPLAVDGRLIQIPLVVVCALPALLHWRLPLAGALLAVLAASGVIIATLVTGLVREARGTVSLADLITNRAEELPGSQAIHPLGNTFVIMCFLAAVVLLVGGRIGTGRERFLGPRALSTIAGIAAVVLSGTFYLEMRLDILTVPVGLPSIVMGTAFWGSTGRIVTAIAFGFLGLVCVFVVYERLPRLLRELAFDGALPARLAAPEASRARSGVVLLVAVLAGALGVFLSTTHAGVVALVFVCFLIFTLHCAALSLRGGQILKTSERREERRAAHASRWGFAFFALAGFAVLLVTVAMQPAWTLTSLAAVAVPTAGMLIAQRGRGKMSAHLKPLDVGAGRRLPVRTHAVVLVQELNLPTLRAVTYARALRPSTLTALTVDLSESRTAALRAAWNQSQLPVGLTVLGSPTSGARGPLVDYIRFLLDTHPQDIVLVIAPKVVSTTLWHRVYLRRSVPPLFADLSYDSRLMLVQVPYQIHSGEDL
ncbi:hypothetical protein [Actinotignum schaalii]|nr:hypothetical protein [Actinotignum schaalii]